MRKANVRGKIDLIGAELVDRLEVDITRSGGLFRTLGYSGQALSVPAKDQCRDLGT
jgi:hypothetical protein